MYKHLLVATDGSEVSNRAVGCGAALSRALQARLTVMTVTQPLITFPLNTPNVENTLQEYKSYLKTWASEVLDKAAALAASAEVECERVYVEDGHPSEAILRVAMERGCDLIVMGSHGRRGLERLLIGSETQMVLTQSTIPVLIVPSRQASAGRQDTVEVHEAEKIAAGG